jgi:hypothetical protein
MGENGFHVRAARETELRLAVKMKKLFSAKRQRRGVFVVPRRFLQSQRDCSNQPKVARDELPWVNCQNKNNPEWVADTTPLGL